MTITILGELVGPLADQIYKQNTVQQIICIASNVVVFSWYLIKNTCVSYEARNSSWPASNSMDKLLEQPSFKCI